MIQTLMAFRHRFSNGMKCGSTILNLNASGNWWNGVTQHPNGVTQHPNGVTQHPNGVTQHPKQRKTFKNALSAGNIVAAICWDEKCITVLNFLRRGTAVKCYWSKEMLRVLKSHCHQVHQTNVRSVAVQ
jgi:hypothetical protein